MSAFHTLRVRHVTRETRDAIVVTLDVPPELEDRFRFVQGQYLTLRATIDGAEVRRSYSICSAVGEGLPRVAVKRVADGTFSCWANENLVPGAAIEVAPPAGHFHLPLDGANRKHYLGFAAGSGITPLLSIIKTTLATEPGSRFTLVYGNRASSTVLFREELLDLKNRHMERLKLVFVMSREQQDLELFNGRIDGAKCDALFRHWIDLADVDAAFICGPEPMMHAVSAALQRHGLDKTRIKIELFATVQPRPPRPRAAPREGSHEQIEATAILDGRRHAFTVRRGAETVLDAALRQGVELPYSCKGGVCTSCRARLIEGEVDMDTVYGLEDYEIARGFILSCQSFPATERLVIDFDDPT
jgi:ring-1,2-phenylacetyl-CoA epoxidase subunit PaaE